MRIMTVMIMAMMIVGRFNLSRHVNRRTFIFGHRQNGAGRVMPQPLPPRRTPQHL